MRLGFGTAAKTGFGQPVPIRVSKGNALWYISSLCVGAHAAGHVRWRQSLRVEQRYVLDVGVMSHFILDAVARRLVPVNHRKQVAVMALWGVG